MSKSFGTPASYKVIGRLEEKGFEAVFVGGAVRDHLLGKQATDIDIATSAEPHEVKAAFSNTVDIGIDHGTVLVIMDNEPIEVTTYRTEGTYTDARRPDHVHFVKSLREDLLRRDFTINALALTKKGGLIDLFGGSEDLKNQIIRAVGMPEERFEEDALRMIRAVRFASVLDFQIEQTTFKAIQVHAKRIENVSVERIKIEMDKLFAGKNPLAALQLILKSNLAEALPLFPQQLSGLKSVLPFTSAIEGWAYLMLAGHFTAGQMSSAYKLSNNEKKYLSAVQKAFEKRKQHPFIKDDLYTFDSPVLYAAEKNYLAIYEMNATVTIQQFEEAKNRLPIQSPKDLRVNGKDLIKWAGMKGGRWVGESMQNIERAVLHGLCENSPNKIKEWFMNDFNSKN